MASNTGRFIWHDLITSDVEGAKAFYGALLGWSYAYWTAEQGNPAPEGSPEYPMIVAGDAMPQGGIMAAQLPGVPPHWIGHVITDDADALAGRATDAGGRIVFGPFDIPGVGRNVLVADPAGAALGFICFAGDAMAPPEPPMPAGSFVWDELMADDLDAAKTFYAAVTGWGAREWDGEVEYSLFQVGERDAAGLMARPADTQAPPAWIAYVYVEDAEASVTKVRELGGMVHAGPFPVPSIGQIAVIGDPQGAVLGLMQPEMSGGGAA